MGNKELTTAQRTFYAVLAVAISLSGDMIAGYVDLNFWGINWFDVNSFHEYVFDWWFVHLFFAVVAGGIGYTHGREFVKIIKFDPDIF